MKCNFCVSVSVPLSPESRRSSCVGTCPELVRTFSLSSSFRCHSLTPYDHVSSSSYPTQSASSLQEPRNSAGHSRLVGDRRVPKNVSLTTRSVGTIGGGGGGTGGGARSEEDTAELQ